MKNPIVAVAALLLVAACSADRGTTATKQNQKVVVPDSQPAPETFALGSEVAADGSVPQSAAGEAFSRGGEVFLSVDVAGASTDQQIKVEWRDQSGHVVRREARHVGEGSRYVAFSSGRTTSWRRGRHRAVITINGRTVSEKPFALL